MRAVLVVLLLAGCNSLLGIPSGGQVGPPGGDDGPAGDAMNIGCQTQPDQCGLFGVDRGIAQVGETITLEGTFGNTVDVAFPGVTAKSAATVLGAHRAAVEVPAGASRGLLEVTTAGTTVGKAAFRGTSYRLGPTWFHGEYPQTNGGRIAPVLGNAKFGATAVQTGNRVFVIGGADITGKPTDILDFATINADGTLSGFSQVPVGDSHLVFGRARHASVAIGGFVYVIGGADMNSPAIGAIERAAINPNGTLGPFTLIENLTTERAGHAAIVIGDGLYVIGGIDKQGIALDSIERAPINPDGSLGIFAVVPNVTLAQARGDFGVFTAKDKLYVVGGTPNGGAGLRSVERATISPDGSIGTFTSLATGLQANRFAHTVVVLGTTVLALGGLDVGNATDTIDTATIMPNGDLSAWTSAPFRLSRTRAAGNATTIVGNDLYLFGGKFTLGSVTDLTASTEHMSVVTDSDLAAFSSAGITLTSTPPAAFSGEALGPFFYTFGGRNGTVGIKTVLRSQVALDDTLQDFTAIAKTLNTPRSRAATLAGNGLIYVIGGEKSTGFLDDVEISGVNDAGDLGGFSILSGSKMSTLRAGHAAIYVGNNALTFGGTNTGIVHLTSVDMIAASTIGQISGAFAVQSSTLSVARMSFCPAVLGNNVYAIGGTGDNNVALSSVERATFDVANNTLTNFAVQSTVNLRVVRGVVTCSVVGRFLYVFGSNSANGKAIERAPITPDGTLGDFAVVTTTALSEARFEHRAVTVQNFIYMIGSFDGTTTSGTVEHAALK